MTRDTMYITGDLRLADTTFRSVDFTIGSSAKKHSVLRCTFLNCSFRLNGPSPFVDCTFDPPLVVENPKFHARS